MRWKSLAWGLRRTGQAGILLRTVPAAHPQQVNDGLRALQQMRFETAPQSPLSTTMVFRRMLLGALAQMAADIVTV